MPHFKLKLQRCALFVAALLLFSAGRMEMPAQDDAGSVPTRAVEMLNTALGDAGPGDSRAVVVVFLAEGCRISQDFSPVLRELHAEFNVHQVFFCGIFPNAHSTDSSMAAYREKYRIPFTLAADVDQSLVEELEARVTPEAFVLLPDGTVAYRGRINDLFYALGRKRSTVTSNDLHDAVAAVAAGSMPAVRETKSIGCLIERSRASANK